MDRSGEPRNQHVVQSSAALFIFDSVDFPKLTRCHLVKPIAGDASLEAQCLRLETLPSRAFGNSQCAQRWKIEPQNLVLRTHATTASWIAAGKRVIKALGYDGGEDRRAGIEVDQYCEFWYPLLIDFGRGGSRKRATSPKKWRRLLFKKGH